MLASILTFTQTAGYPLLFALIAAESAGVPLPGETALLTAASLAGQGKLSIALVIAVAAIAAIVGDNIGYLVSRKGGRRLLQRPGPFARQRRRVLEVGEPFFERHGPKAVFFGRWILGLRSDGPQLPDPDATRRRPRLAHPPRVLRLALGRCSSSSRSQNVSNVSRARACPNLSEGVVWEL